MGLSSSLRPAIPIPHQICCHRLSASLSADSAFDLPPFFHVGRWGGTPDSAKSSAVLIDTGVLTRMS